MKTKWKLTDKLVSWSGNKDFFRLRDACEGVHVFGATGGGKTSGPLQYLAKSFLSNQYGALILCAKSEEVSTWSKFAKEERREKDLIYLSQNSFDFLMYESSRKGPGAGEIENIVDVFMELAEMGSRASGKSGDPYWDRACRQILRNTISLLKFTSQDVNLENISKLISTLPFNPEQFSSSDWKDNTYCGTLLNKCCNGKNIPADQLKDYEVTERFIAKEYPELDNRTRSNIGSFFTTLADSFLRGTIRKIFCNGKVDITPEMCMDGKIIIVDLSIDEWKETGRYSAGIFKYLLQSALRRRTDKASDSARPVFIFGDESHFFVTKNDSIFQSVARSSRGIVVYATQNYPKYVELMDKEAPVDALLGNFGTKIFCQNGDKKTNNWASDSIDKEIKKRKGKSITGHGILSKIRVTNSISEQKDYIIDPIEFQKLKKGGKDFNYKVGSILWQGGVEKSNKKNYLKLEFDQRKQPKIENNLFIYRNSIYTVTAALVFLFAYYMYKNEVSYVYNVFITRYSYMNPYLMKIAASLLVAGLLYTLFINTKLFILIFIVLIEILLALSMIYLKSFSPLHLRCAYYLNIYLFIFGIFYFFRKVADNRIWKKPVIIKG